MPKYRVTIPYCVWVHVEVDAETEEDAEEIAFDEVGAPSQLVGNGGTDKMVGVNNTNEVKASIESSDEPLDLPRFRVEVTEITESEIE